MTRFLVKDHYFHKAKKEGFRARSVFKLEEIEQKLKLIHKDDLVLDLGAAPGSWLQYVAKRLMMGQGQALGVDLSEILSLESKQIKTLKADVFLLTKEQIINALAINEDDFSGFNVILSDMAPKTTGIRHVDQERSFNLSNKALELALGYLKPKGHVVIKIFEGPNTKDLMSKIKSNFQNHKIFRPKSVRSVSKEFYALGISKKT